MIMAQDFLTKIIDYKKQLLKTKKPFLQGLKKNASASRLNRYRVFKENISKPGKVNLIAEVKKASPSKGIIVDNFDAMKIAGIYEQSGAAAISVLTEDKFFLGKMSYIKQISENFRTPVLRKDFIIDEVQVYESFNLGASAVLLIVAILDDGQLKHLMQVASSLDMCSLVEVHNQKELKRALAANAEIIGINNRDLRTFEVDLKVSRTLISQIPKDKVIVVESGISTHEDVIKLKEWGVHAVLVGETLLRAKDIGAKIRELMNGM